jgi:hypothetical protein
MGMGRASGAMQNQMGGMGGKGGQQPQGGFRGKGGAQQTQGGFGGKGAGRFQPQQPPQGGFSGKGGQQQNPYAQQYYQPQFQPEYFNNPYSQGGFGQQPQMGGFGGKGGQSGIGDFERSQFQQGGMGGKGGQMGNNQVQNARYNPPGTTSNVPQYAQDLYQQMQGQQMGGMGGKGGQRDTSQQAYNYHMATAQYAPGGAPTYEQWAAQRQSADKMGPILQKPGVPPQGGMGGKGGPMSGYRQQLQQRRMADMLRGVPQQSGLAALQQPTATTQAVAPEQPYMGNYLK